MRDLVRGLGRYFVEGMLECDGACNSHHESIETVFLIISGATTFVISNQYQTWKVSHHDSKVVTCITAALYMVLFKLIFVRGCDWQTFFTYFMVKGMAETICLA